MTVSLVNRAAFEYQQQNYSKALVLYRQLASQIGERFFFANIALCQKKLRSVECIVDSEQKSFSSGKVLVFTNLGLSTIDGSSVFVANAVNLFSELADEVHLLCVHSPGDNFNDRLIFRHKTKTFTCGESEIVEEIARLDECHSYIHIFVRAFGNSSLWFDEQYAGKLIYYWTLRPEPSDDDKRIYHAVKTIAFQTDDLRDFTFGILGNKESFLMPPVVNLPIKQGTPREFSNNAENITISYVGTLRPECYSFELLSEVLKVVENESKIHFRLAIGKIFYKDYNQKKLILSLVEKLREKTNVLVEEKVSPERCDDLLMMSDLSFSLWQPTPENVRQISTKLLECLAGGVNVICIETPLYKKLLGEDYPYFIKTMDDLPEVMSKAIHDSKSKSFRYRNQYLLSKFSRESQVARLLSFFQIRSSSKQINEARLFANQFDNIYGLYINKNEKRKLSFINDRYGLHIQLFEGVNAKLDLQEEFKEYLMRPLDGDWEKKAQKKRLSIGAMGHLHSFIRIAKDAIEKNYKKILILEADVIFHKNAFHMNANLRPDDFKVLYYGAGKWNRDVVYTDSGFFYTPRQTTGTFAIAFDQSVLVRCISEWEKFNEPTDVALWSITDDFESECFVHSPNLMICDVATSSTTTSRSQEQLSSMFDWNLKDYDLHGVEDVSRYVSRMTVVADHYIEDASVVVHCGFQTIRLNVETSELCIDVHDTVDYIEYNNLFIKTVTFQDQE